MYINFDQNYVYKIDKIKLKPELYKDLTKFKCFIDYDKDDMLNKQKSTEQFKLKID